MENEMKDIALDKERLKDVVESIAGKYPSNLDITLDESCQKLFLDYLDEVTLATVELAVMFAQHRGSSIVEEEDIHLVLEKKFGIPVPGTTKKTPLYKHSYHALSNKESTRKNGTSPDSSTVNDGGKRGTKRKSIQ